VSDGQRDRPHNRGEMHRLFRDRLDAWHAPVVDVKGNWDVRRATAFAAVEQLLQREQRT